MLNHRAYTALAVVVLLIAAGLRMANLSTHPPGLHTNEITTIRLIETVRQGRVEVFYEVNDKITEGFYPLTLALTTTLTGKGILGYRIASFWAGMLTLAVIYQLGTRLFGSFAGLTAMILMTGTMWVILLSRQVLPITLVPLSVSAVLLALARTLPIHGKSSGSNLLNAAAGIVIGVSLYIHPANILILFASLLFIIYMITIRREIKTDRRQIGHILFVLVVAFIIALPYIFSSIQRPNIANLNRIFGEFDQLIPAITRGIGGIFIKGDSNPIYNLPGRPLVDLISTTLVIIGIIIAIRYWRRPPFTLILLAGIILLPSALFSADGPSFIAYTGILPIFAIFFSLGISVIYTNLRNNQKNYRLVFVGLTILFGLNLIWAYQDFFINWKNNEDMFTAYHGELGQDAHYLDRTAHQISTMVCDPAREADSSITELSNTQLIVDVMMNRKETTLRYGDCRTSLIFSDGGSQEQILLTEPDLLEMMHPHLREWLLQGQALKQNNLSPNSVIILDMRQQLADAAGLFTTTSPIRFLSKTTGELGPPVFPPIRFGGNITLLGYEKPEVVIYRSGDRVSFITYWRAEGIVPPDLTIFTHILRDPVTIAAQRDIISVEPRSLQERDVFIQVTYIDLPENMLDGEYLISIGAYQSQSDDRLSIFDEDETERNQLFLYPIIVDSSG